MSKELIQARFEAQQQQRRLVLSVRDEADNAPDRRTERDIARAAMKERVRTRAVDTHPTIWRDPSRHESVIQRALREAVAAEPGLSSEEQDRLLAELVAEVLGWGVVDQAMRDPGVTEIMIDNPASVGYLRDGMFHWLTEDFPNDAGARIGFDSDDALRTWLERIMKTSERALNYEHPLLDDDLPEGARLNATAPPVTEHLTTNIRKSVAQTHSYRPEEYVAQGIWSAEEIAFLLAVVRGYANIIVAGPTASGKTTVIRQLIEFGMDPMDRILSIEDIRETNASHPRFLSLMTVPRKENPIGFRELFATSMRKTPTRVMVSELRGPQETVAFFETIASGHPGAITSQHGADPLDIIDWLTARAVQGGLATIPEIVQRMIYRALHLIVFIRAVGQGRRRVTGVYELVPVELQATVGANVRPLFLWDRVQDVHRWVNDPLETHLEQWEFLGVEIPRRLHEGAEPCGD